MNKYKTIIIILIALFLFSSILLIVFWLKHPIRIVIENNSKEQIEEVSVSVGKQIVSFGELEPSDRKVKWLLYEGSDSSFLVNAKMKNGKLLNERFGYITHGPGLERIHFELKDNDKINYHHKY